MTEEIKNALKDVEKKLYILSYDKRVSITKEERQNLRHAWYYVYGVLNQRL